MIGVMLQGGLGNQLFQYSLGRALSLSHNTPLALNLSLLRDKRVVIPRTYALGNFQTCSGLMSESEEKNCRSRYSLISLFNPSKTLKMVREKSPLFNPKFLSLPDNVCLNGYFQSENYFKEITADLLQELRLSSALEESDLKIARHIDSTSSIVVHVRRGDYLTNPRFPLCSKEYFSKGVQDILERNSGCEIFVFSDDISWCRNNLSFSVPTNFIARGRDDEAHIELALMTHGKYFVISNSSFSWWGAWLASFPGKKVIAPRVWFNPKYLDDRDVVPQSWIRI